MLSKVSMMLSKLLSKVSMMRSKVLSKVSMMLSKVLSNLFPSTSYIYLFELKLARLLILCDVQTE